EQYYTKRLNGNNNRHPCDKRAPVRFSDESRSQCTHNRIKDSEPNNNDVGACAPFRRLSVCDYNLEKMGRTSTTTNKLLAEVCLAAKYEGQSISVQHGQYHTDSSGSTICTMLARSFADIGDIVRGRDMFKRTDKDYVENDLREVFNNIYGQLENNAQAYYSDKDKSRNYYT
ncbi:duffy binding-like domain-containing protein, partial [Streptococcus australis]